jgi:deazaflavin-dependent oxidoreductase (nitroreductase family)
LQLLVTLEPQLASEDFCYITATGRVTGKPREIEIWFGANGDTIYMLSGGREKSDWVKNIRKTPEVSVRIGEQRCRGRGRIVTGKDEDALARRLLLEKYAPGYSGSLSDWGHTALPVAIDLEEESGR